MEDMFDPTALIKAFQDKAGDEPIIAAVQGRFVDYQPLCEKARVCNWRGVRGSLEYNQVPNGGLVAWTPTRTLYSIWQDDDVTSVEDIRDVPQPAAFPWFSAFDPAAIRPDETVQEAYERQIDEDTQADIDAGEYESGESWDEGDPSVSNRSRYFTTGA
jgi:hypothetical protein